MKIIESQSNEKERGFKVDITTSVERSSLCKSRSTSRNLALRRRKIFSNVTLIGWMILRTIF